MPSILGLFKTAEEAAAATDRLRESGVAPEDYDVLTGSPYPEGAFGEHVKPHRLYIFPLAGAMIGFSIALLLTAGTQLSYPMITGGKPILAIPPMIVIMYEGTMLGALIFSVLGVLFEARIPTFGRELYDARIADGWIGLLVHCKDIAQVETVRTALLDAGAEEVKQQRSRP
jgi:hypothetical protein